MHFRSNLGSERETNGEEKERKTKKSATSFECWQLVGLDKLFMECDGRPEKKTVNLAASSLKMDVKQVSAPRPRLFSYQFVYIPCTWETISYCSFIVQAHFTICDFFSQCRFRSEAACPPSDTCTTALHFTHLIVFSKLSSEENAFEKPFFSSCSRIRSTVGDPSTERCQERRKRKTMITIRIIFSSF